MALIALSTTQRQHLRRLGGRTQSPRRLTTFGGRLPTRRGPASDVELPAEPDEEETLD
jgi:hypothetical protein